MARFEQLSRFVVDAILGTVCVLLVLAGIVPVLSGLYQFMAAPLSYFAGHFEDCAPHRPRCAVLIPAWNEGAVIGTTIDRLMGLDYPPDRLRVYVIDDASSDATSAIAIEKAQQFPDRVFHVRRVAGGEGKAHTLNYGLRILQEGDWMEAVLIMDADVIYTKSSLGRMARHLADGGIGAVTGNIKEGSANPNYVQRFVTFEYATATGASRRAQNVFGFLACLSGGAQLHSRDNLRDIGGRIYSNTLAEDTFTTFRTQLSGRRAIFEPNAVVYAEEPDSLVGLWKQRLRWGRGNVQITREFARLWGHRQTHQGLGSLTMSLVWFSIFLMPVLQMGATFGLIGLYFLDAPLAWKLFECFWIISGVVYLVVTVLSCVIDWESARKSVLEGLLFPGVVSLVLIVSALFPPFGHAAYELSQLADHPTLEAAGVLFIYAWLSLSMVVAWGAKRLEETKYAWLSPWLIYLGGYGPFLCAVTFASYVAEIRGAAMVWDKTEKTGKVAA